MVGVVCFKFFGILFVVNDKLMIFVSVFNKEW